MQLPRLHLRGGGGAVGDDAPDDAVEIGLVGAPVVRIAVGDDVLAALIFDEFERPRADGGEIDRVLADVALALVKMARRDIAEIGQGAQQQVERHGPLVAEHRGVRVGRVDGGQEELQRRAVVEDLLPHLHRRVLHVGGGEGRPVVPGHALAQLEGDGLAVGRGLPAFGEHADGVPLRVEIDQRLLDLAADDVDAGRGLKARVQLALLGAVMHAEHAALARRLLREGAERIGDVGGDGGGGEKRGAAGEIHARLSRARDVQADSKLTMTPLARAAGKLTRPSWARAPGRAAAAAGSRVAMRSAATPSCGAPARAASG